VGFFDRIGREVSKGLGAIGGFAGNVIGGAVEAFRQPGRTEIPGIGGAIGGFFGDVGESILGDVLSQGSPFPGGGIGGDIARRQALIPGAAPGTFLGGAQLGRPLAFQLTQAQPTEIIRPASVGESPGPAGTTEVPQMAGINAAALPGGALIAPLLRQLGTGALVGAGFGGAQALLGGGGGDVELPFGGSIFRTTMSGVRARSLVEVVNPATGRKTWFRNVGRPILFSGDLRACKRVNKVAARARRSRGR